MEKFFRYLVIYFSENFWLVKVLSILVVAFAINWVVLSVYLKLKPRFEKTERAWDDTLLEAIQTPLSVLIWALAVTLFIPTLATEMHIQFDVYTYLVPFQRLLFILALLWFVMRFINQLESKLQQRSPFGKQRYDKTTIRAVSQVTRIAVIVIAILLGMNILGIPIGTLLAAGGFGAIAIGFAAKDTLSNFIGGMMIFWDRPFSVGDWILSPDRQVEGTVEHIGWRLTRIRTFDKRPLYVPNGVFSTISIENPSRMTNRRIKTTIGLRYDDATKVAVILRDVEAMLRQHSEIDTNQTLMVNLFEFGASSLNFFIYTFTKTTEWVSFQAIQQDIFLKVIDIITQHGAECAFPTTTLHVPEGIALKDKQFENFMGEGKSDDYGTETKRAT